MDDGLNIKVEGEPPVPDRDERWLYVQAFGSNKTTFPLPQPC